MHIHISNISQCYRIFKLHASVRHLNLVSFIALQVICFNDPLFNQSSYYLFLIMKWLLHEATSYRFFLYFWINNTFTVIFWIHDFGQNTSISFKHSLIPKIYGCSVFQIKKTHFSNAFYSSHLFFTHFLPCFCISSASIKLCFVPWNLWCLFVRLSVFLIWDDTFVVLSGCKSLWLCS